jgi:hypothetical protein
VQRAVDAASIPDARRDLKRFCVAGASAEGVAAGAECVSQPNKRFDRSPLVAQVAEDREALTAEFDSAPKIVKNV